jgi:hypothetical protein
MENLLINPIEIGVPFPGSYVETGNVRDIASKIHDLGWNAIPRVAVCNLPNSFYEKFGHYERLTIKKYVVLCDGLHRRSTAFFLKCQLPCTQYEPEDTVNMSMHGDSGTLQGEHGIKDLQKAMKPSWKIILEQEDVCRFSYNIN